MSEVDNNWPGLRRIAYDAEMKADKVVFTTLDVPVADMQDKNASVRLYLSRGKPEAKVFFEGMYGKMRPFDTFESLTRKGIQDRLDDVNFRVLGIHPVTKNPIAVYKGPFGAHFDNYFPYKSGKIDPDSISKTALPYMNYDTVTLQDALDVMSLPKILGVAEDDEQIYVDYGRHGSFVKWGSTKHYRLLAKDRDLFTITLEEAIALFDKPHPKRGRGYRKLEVVRDLGVDPATGRNITVIMSKFPGIYAITDTHRYANLTRRDWVGNITLERCVDLLNGAEERRTLGGYRREHMHKHNKLPPEYEGYFKW